MISKKSLAMPSEWLHAHATSAGGPHVGARPGGCAIAIAGGSHVQPSLLFRETSVAVRPRLDRKI
jgi:hypothetical protein